MFIVEIMKSEEDLKVAMILLLVYQLKEKKKVAAKIRNIYYSFIILILI